MDPFARTSCKKGKRSNTVMKVPVQGIEDANAPVMTDGNTLLNAMLVKNADDLLCHLLQAVGFLVSGLVSTPIAKQIRGDDAIAFFDEMSSLISPVKASLWEAVTEQQVRAGLRGGVDVGVRRACACLVGELLESHDICAFSRGLSKVDSQA